MSPVVNTVVSILFDGLAWAMFLFIISVGLSVTMGLMGVVNLAHGAFAMAGGYLVLTATASWGVPFLASLVITFLVVGAVSVIFERTLYSELYGASELDQVLLDHRPRLHGDRGLHLFLRPAAEDDPRSRLSRGRASLRRDARFRPIGSF